MTKEGMRKLLVQEKGYVLSFINDKLDRIEIETPHGFDEIYYYNTFIKSFPSQAWYLFKERHISSNPLTGRHYKLTIRMKDEWKATPEQRQQAIDFLVAFFESKAKMF